MSVPSGLRAPSETATTTDFICSSSPAMRSTRASSVTGDSGSRIRSGHTADSWLASTDEPASQPVLRPMISTKVTLRRSYTLESRPISATEVAMNLAALP